VIGGIPAVARASGHRGWRLAVLVTALIAAAGISTPAQARTAADPGAGVAATDPVPELTGLAASVLTRPSAVRAVREDGSGSAGEYGRRPAAARGQELMTDGVHPSVDPVEPPGGHAATNRAG
jgi:hypothetical protein